MAQKFANGRWVQEGFLDNRVPGTVVGRVVFAGIGAVDFFLRGDFKTDIAGNVIRFRNSRFEEEDMAAHVLADMENPQLGTVYLISFDPHPNLMPHPYVEWFSQKGEHYRFELSVGEAWIVQAAELAMIDQESQKIRASLTNLVFKPPLVDSDRKEI
ncbi:MAG: hypothetical protein NNA18_02945 [Nitrospira sp.]|nr:hypothetical protein [Nitrospira sp.]